MSALHPISPPCRLRTNRLANPMGIDTPHPVFSWINPWSVRGARQTAVQIVVACVPVVGSSAVIWDSGKIPTEDGWLPYAGRELSCRERLEWRVRAWDEKGRPTEWSEPAFFEMGLWGVAEWKGWWIGSMFMLAPIFRYPFRLSGPPTEVRRARLYTMAAGYQEPRLNGSKVGDQVLSPDYTDFTQRITYVTLDVAGLLREGENLLGMMLGGGWFEHNFYGPPQFRCRLEIDHGEGNRQVVGEDYREWRASPGPWLERDVIHGEHYDARLEQPGWDAPGFDELGRWFPVLRAQTLPDSLQTHAGGRPVGLRAPPIRVTQDLTPIACRRLAPNTVVYDFGQNFAGWIRLRCRGSVGTSLTLRHAELANPDGSVNPITSHDARNTDRYVLRGTGLEEWEPRFTYHGFRYVQVEGSPALPADLSVVGRVVHSDIPRRGRWACSDKRLNRLFLNMDWSLRSNLMSVFTDCPQRGERQGWLGDGLLVADTLLHHFDAGAFLTKWMDDIRETQGEAGNRWAAQAPVWGMGGKQGAMLRLPPDSQSDAVWTAAGTLIPWFLLLYDNNRVIVEDHYGAIMAHLGFLAERRRDGLVPFGTLGDWLFVGFEKEKDPTDPIALATAFFIEQSRVAARMALVMRRKNDQTQLTGWKDEAAEALRQRFYRADSATFGSQTLDALSLEFGFAPPEDRSRVFASLVRDIQERCGGHLKTGFVGTKYLLEALSAGGRADVAWDVVTATGYPGWMHMLDAGLTTIPERWDFYPMTEFGSLNHATFGVVTLWMFRWLAGIRVDPEAPGYRRFWFAPEPVGGLTWCEATLDTVRGPLKARWDRAGSAFRCEVTIPPSCECTAVLPGTETGGARLTIDGSPIEAAQGKIDPATRRISIRLSAGHYRIEVDP